MRASESPRGRLFSHDFRIATNPLRATCAGWHDRLIAATMLLVALAVVRSWCAARLWEVAAGPALVAGIITGMGAGRLVAARLRFHGFDGLLAADALQPSTRRRYMVTWHAIGVAILTVVTLVARPSLLIVTAPAYLIGAVLAHTAASLAMSRAAVGKGRPLWTIRRWLHHPGAGIVAAIILLVSLLPAHPLGTNAVIAVVGIEAVLLTLVLTMVDDGAVRFMTIAGHGPWRIVLRHAQGTLLFAGLAVPVCWVAFGPVAAGIVTAAAAAMLLLLALRILAYRLHAKRFADLLVSICAGLLMVVAYSMPVLLPFLALAILWQLQRRAAARTWLLA